MNLTSADRDAMARALSFARRESPARARQIFDMLSERPWETVGRFASYNAQTTTLHLEPWEWPPVWITNIEAALSVPDDARHIPGSARLLKRMIDAGLSRYEPDPLAALDEVEQRQTAK